MSTKPCHLCGAQIPKAGVAMFKHYGDNHPRSKLAAGYRSYKEGQKKRAKVTTSALYQKRYEAAWEKKHGRRYK